MSPLAHSATLEVKLRMLGAALESDFVRAHSHKQSATLEVKLRMLGMALESDFV